MVIILMMVVIMVVVMIMMIMVAYALETGCLNCNIGLNWVICMRTKSELQ